MSVTENISKTFSVNAKSLTVIFSFYYVVCCDGGSGAGVMFYALDHQSRGHRFGLLFLRSF